MLSDEPIEHGIEFRRHLSFGWLSRRPDFKNISRALPERTAAQGRADDPSLGFFQQTSLLFHRICLFRVSLKRFGGHFIHPHNG
jgi:hypothetical protein